jgi:hypothetical protein
VSPRGAFDGAKRLLIDGNNLLHRTAGATGEGQVRQLLARLRAAVPPDLSTTVMLDGHPAPGEGQRLPLTRSLEIRHSGSRPADDALIDIVAAEPPWARAHITLVTDDRALVERARTLGARTQRLAWLDELLSRPTRSDGHRVARIGAGRPPPTADDEPEREPWKPGRGATRKKGNPRRQRRGGAAGR